MVYPNRTQASGVWKLNNPNSVQINNLAHKKLYSQFPDAGNRAIFFGGLAPGESNIIDFITVSSTGNAADFGDLVSSKYNPGSCSNGVQGFCLGGYDGYPTESNVIEHIHFDTKGNGADFANLNVSVGASSGASNNTRALRMGGGDASVGYENSIDYFTMSTRANAVDFGNLTQSRGQGGTVNNTTRAVNAGGIIATNDNQNTMDFHEIATTGDFADFGDMTAEKNYLSGCSDSTRGIWLGGDIAPSASYSNVIEYITMMSKGNGTDFGDLGTAARGNDAVSNSVRGVYSLGEISGTFGLNTIEYVTIQTTGNAVDFGDLSTARARTGGTSDSHGGLEIGNQGVNPIAGKDMNRWLLPFGEGNLVCLGPGDSRHYTTEWLNLMTKGNTIDWGDLTMIKRICAGNADSIRAFMHGGYDASANALDTIEMSFWQHKGAWSDWGDLINGGAYNTGSMGSSTRCIAEYANAIEYFSPTTDGN